VAPACRMIHDILLRLGTVAAIATVMAVICFA
jgi:hypothetical protein